MPWPPSLSGSLTAAGSHCKPSITLMLAHRLSRCSRICRDEYSINALTKCTHSWHSLTALFSFPSLPHALLCCGRPGHCGRAAPVSPLSGVPRNHTHPQRIQLSSSSPLLPPFWVHRCNTLPSCAITSPLLPPPHHCSSPLKSSPLRHALSPLIMHHCSRLSRVLITRDVWCQYSSALPTPLPSFTLMPESFIAISAPDSAPASISSFMLPRWPMRNTWSQRRGERVADAALGMMGEGAGGHC